MYIYVKVMIIKTDELIKIGKSLSDPNRIEILKLLSNGEICACNLLKHFNIKQPTLSHHMKQLNDSKLVKTNKKGTWSHYSINKETFKNLEKFSKKMANSPEQNYKLSCNND